MSQLVLGIGGFLYYEDREVLIAIGLKPSTFVLGDSETVRVVPEAVTNIIRLAFALAKTRHLAL